MTGRLEMPRLGPPHDSETDETEVRHDEIPDGLMKRRLTRRHAHVALGQSGGQLEGVGRNVGAVDLLHGFLQRRLAAGIGDRVERDALEADGRVHLVPIHVFGALSHHRR